MLEIFSTLLTGALSGGATGLLGVLMQRFFDYKTKTLEIEVVKLNHANSLELAKLEGEQRAARNATDERLAELEFNQTSMVEDSQNMRAAFEHDKASYISSAAVEKSGFVTVLFGLVDALRGFVRPGMTLYLCGLVTYLFLWARDLAGVSDLTQDQAHGLVLQVITTITYVFTTVTLFWFGTRGTNQK